MQTKGDLVQAFNEVCLFLASNLPGVLTRNINRTDDGYYLRVNGTDMDDVATWWTEDTKNSFINDWEWFKAMHPEKFQAMCLQGKGQLEFNPRLLDQYKKIKAEADRRLFAPFYFMQLFPHLIINGPNGYGRDLYETTGYKSLEMTCKAVGGIQADVYFSLNPKVESLRAAFYLALDIRTTDKTPLRPKIEAAAARGLFRQH